MTAEITGMTELYGVMANPIKHSLSPLIYNTAFQYLHMDAVYMAFEVDEANFDAAYQAIIPMGIKGLNISMPYKKDVMTKLLADNYKVSDVAVLASSCNTVVNQGCQLEGHNTDGLGFILSLNEHEIDIDNKVLTILGAGGAARSIIIQAAKTKVKEINIFKRMDQKFNKLVLFYQSISERFDAKINVFPYEDEEKMALIISQSDILVNATQVGMVQQPGLPIPTCDFLHKNLVVSDLIYYPLQTELLKKAEENGCQTINGIGMLIHQAAYSFNLMTNQEMPVAVVKKAVHQHLEKEENRR
ncbi:shikimate dehydrogenase [Vagococcus vulneris]|uniref:Shikimate dehydrogenase (NADP(+)) n=1 Tax=Vagococcus vulneris TaxID=1977869 RepID=A0A430A2S5_9ENTE|nr:shikimate dehydrogenase [Vagococcus vulneris]RSU00712.1 shikimate dehydrogenase [Vagococcus vulneris]